MSDFTKLKTEAKRWEMRMTDIGALDIAATFNRQQQGGAEALAQVSNDNPEFHEPDAQAVAVELRGRTFDDAMCSDRELHLVLKKDGQVVGKFNLALVLALAADRLKEAEQRRAAFLAGLEKGAKVWYRPGGSVFVYRGEVTRCYDDGTVQVRAQPAQGFADEGVVSVRLRREQVGGSVDGAFVYGLGV